MMDTLELKEDFDGGYLLEFSDELIEAMDWKEGDVLDFKFKGNGIFITKVNQPEEFIELE